MSRSSNALFELEWQGDGAVAFRANNGKYLMTKRSGHLYANADSIDDNCKYYFYLINRSVLTLCTVNALPAPNNASVVSLNYKIRTAINIYMLINK